MGQSIYRARKRGKGIMLRVSTLVIGICLAGLSSSYGASSGDQEGARALVFAKRVAAQEKNRGLPSRAVWLSHRVVKNSKALAYQSPKAKASRKNKSQKN